MSGYSDAALESWYRNRYERIYGYDPLDPYGEDPDEDDEEDYFEED